MGGRGNTRRVGGSIKIKADTTYKKDTRRASDYSSTITAHIGMERIPPPEGIQKFLDMQNEVVQSAMQVNKTIIEKQADMLSDAAGESEIPSTLSECEGGSANAAEQNHD